MVGGAVTDPGGQRIFRFWSDGSVDVSKVNINSSFWDERWYASICPDTNGDGVTDVQDMVNVLLDWGTDGSDHGGDVTGDGMVDVQDLVEVILEWGDCQ